MLTRRQCLKTGLGTFIFAAAQNGFVRANPTEKSHRVLHIVIPNGVDTSYFFDARPFSFTQNNWMQNYNVEPPALVKDAIGRGAWFTQAGQKLWTKHKNKLSVLNGTLMSVGFDGHEQNLNQLMTGNPFGGRYFLNDLPHDTQTLDSISVGDNPFFNPSNVSNSLKLNYDNLQILSEASGEGDRNISEDAADRAVKKRYAQLGNTLEPGLFYDAVQGMQKGLDSAPSIQRALARIKLDKIDGPLQRDLQILKGVFLSNLSSQILFVPNSALPNNQIFNLDAHSSDQAKQYPMLAMAISDAISTILDFLESTPANAEGTELLLDSTTILISSEFGRTMRQLDTPINNTGTDHNSLTSLCLVGGKGITSGLNLGATDMASLDSEGKVQGLNSCHQSLDDKLLKLMGQGYDYKTGISFVDMAPEFDSTRYLNIDSVINTVLKCVNAPLEQYRTVSAREGGGVAPLVTSLLS